MIPRIILAAAVLMLGAGSAQADVAALSYTDTASQVQTVAPSRQNINPTGALILYLTAGLDRKVGYVIKDGAGASVAQGISGLITGVDTFTVLGQTHYGKVLTVPSALAEGSYTLTAQILTSAGAVVATQNYALVVDRTPPTAGELWWLARPALDPPKSIMANEVVGGSDVRQIWVKSVSDANGIASVRFETYDPAGGTVHTTQTGWYAAATQEAGLGSSSGVPAGSLPAFDGPLGVRFILADQAGNATVAAAVVRYDGTCDPLPQLVAVYNPGVTTEYLPGSGLVGYQEYLPGMAVQANPMKLLYRLPRSNWANDNPDYGLSAFGGTVAYTDAQYVYFRFEVPYDVTRCLNANTWRFTNPRWYTAGQLSYNLVLATGVTQSPALIAWQVYRTDTGWTAAATVAEAIKVCTNGSGQVTKLRAQVEARPYEQQVTFTSAGNISPCTVPAGATECTADITYSPPASGYAYISKLVQVKSADGTLYTTTTPNLLVLYDLAGPGIISYDLNQAARTLSFVVNKPNNGAVSNNIYLKNGWLLATETSTLNQITIPGLKTALGGDLYRINVNFAALPQGNWSLQVQARDEAENVATQNIGSLALDTAAPAVQIFRSGVVLSDHDAIDSLGKVSFTVTDNVDPNPVVQSVRLTGGPESTDVYLACHVKNGAYILEYPVLYPSGGSEYTLTVQARDAGGNVQTRSCRFPIIPRR